MAPPRNPAPKPQPNPRPHTFSTSVPAAFLIASASANGAADATLEAATTPAASTAATDMFSIRLDIGFLRFFRAGCPKRCRPTMSFVRRYATEIRHAGLIRQGRLHRSNGGRRLLRNFFSVPQAVDQSSPHQERFRECRILRPSAHLVAIALTLDRVALLHVLLVSNGGSLD